VFATVFICLLIVIALSCVTWARKAWRDPDNWYIDPEDKHLAFDNWAELALASLLCLACCIGLVAGLQF
jgi:hypothetical protein